MDFVLVAMKYILPNRAVFEYNSFDIIIQRHDGEGSARLSNNGKCDNAEGITTQSTEQDEGSACSAATT